MPLQRIKKVDVLCEDYDGTEKRPSICRRLYKILEREMDNSQGQSHLFSDYQHLTHSSLWLWLALSSTDNDSPWVDPVAPRGSSARGH